MNAKPDPPFIGHTQRSRSQSIWAALGLEEPNDDQVRTPNHSECVLPDGLIVDREIAQIVAILRASGVATVECCADGWGSGHAYVIVRTVDDLARASCLLGHQISVRAAESLTSASGPEPSQWQGPWWPSGDGWAIGLVTEPGGACPALAWPRSLTQSLTRRLVETTGAVPVPIRRVPLRTRLDRGGIRVRR